MQFRPKNKTGEWGGVVCDNDKTKDACLSWFSILALQDDEPLACQVFELFEGGTPKARLLIRRSNGSLRELRRVQRARDWTVTSKPPSADLLKYARECGVDIKETSRDPS